MGVGFQGEEDGDFIEECGGVFFGEDGSIDDFDGVVLFGGGAMCA